MDSWHRRFPAQCAKGDEGERATAHLLEQLPPNWRVLHNVFLPGRKFNIDHVLVGPGGVIALDSKNYSGTVKVVDGTMRVSGYRKANEIAAAREHADCLGAVLEVVARPAICVHAAQLPVDHFVVDTVDVVAPERLVRWLSTLPTILIDIQVSAITAVARGRLDVRELPMLPPARARAPKVHRERPKQSATSRRFEKLFAEALSGVAVLGLAAWWLPHQVKSMQHSAATTATSVATAAASAAPPTLRSGTFSCSGKGHGWTLSMPWPGGTVTGYQAQWAPAPEGPWSSTPAWTSGAPLSIGGLGPGTRVFVRAKASGAPADSPESMAMEKVPTGAC